MDEDSFDHLVPCSSAAAESAIRIASAGAIWGLCMGPYEADRNGLKGMAKASHTARLSIKSGTNCGFVAVLFTGARCGLRRYRGQDDWVNGFIAAGVTGAVVAARTGARVIPMASMVSVACGAAEYYRLSR
ncbi:hypothetical protein RIF29_22020 [Crotalaria pallida]|uniref:Uncharacterized protein n=1 Tax=Crotalaria pallida TaxID=3830 RepID=A0AAN9F3M4_CROPI